MNTHRTAIRRGFTAFAISAAFFTATACGTETSPPTQDIGGTQEKQADPPAQGPRTSIPRTDFGDEYGTPTARPTPVEEIDRTKDWH